MLRGMHLAVGYGLVLQACKSAPVSKHAAAALRYHYKFAIATSLLQTEAT